MKSFAVLLATTLILTSPALSAQSAFHHSWADAQRAATEQGKPIYLHFTIDGCGWCRMMEQQTYPSSAGSAALAGFVVAILDCTDRPDNAEYQQNRTLLDRFGGHGYPHLVMTTPDQAVLNVFSGYLPPDPFAAQLRQAGQRFASLRQAQADAGSGDYARSLAAMKAFRDVRLWDQAASAAAAVLGQSASAPAGEQAMAHWVVIRAAIEREAAADQPGATIREHLPHVRRLDGANAQGVLEEAMAGLAQWQMRQAQDGIVRQDGADAKAHVEEALGYLRELTGGVALRDGQTVWATAGQVHAFLQQWDQAIVAFRKAYDAAPNSEMAPRIRQLIDQLHKQTAQARRPG